MRRCAFLIVLILLLSTSTSVLASSSRSNVVIDHEIPKQDWYSDETISVTQTIRNSPYNTNYTILWELYGENGPNSILSCLLYTSPSPRDGLLSRMPSSA